MKQSELEKLVEQMTVEEKVGQTIQLAAPFFLENENDLTGPMNEMAIDNEKKYQVGSVLGLSGAHNTRKVQEEYLKKNRLGIPLLFMADVIHGDTTIFPIPLALGATWDPEEVEKVAEISAKEAAVQGLHITFSPMVDLVRDPRWGRVLESTGEDKELNKRFAKAFVKGYQGDNLKEDLTKIAACIKHFAGYGAPRGGRDYNSVDLNENTFREHYLPAYREGIDAGAKLVMTAFNTIESIPATGNKRLMREILRKELSFNGVLISDWGAVGELLPHGVAENMREAAELAIRAGVDIEMMSAAYSEHLKNLVKDNTDIEQLLNETVLRILELKNDLGLFENPYRGADTEKEKSIVFSKEHREAARTIAEKSMVLLKNNEILPLSYENKVALTGPMKDSTDLLGSWSWKGKKEKTKTVKLALKERLNQEGLIVLEEKEIFDGIRSYTLSKLDEIDTVLVVLGESSEMSGEAASRTNIMLPKNQLLFLKELKKLNKKIVVVLFNGRPLDLSEVEPLADAVIEAWFPGTEGAEALMNILYGESNPSGKLPMTFPRTVGQVPIFYNEDNTGRPLKEGDKSDKYLSRYLDCENTPLYSFGYGLSYTTYQYSTISLSSDTLSKTDSIRATVIVTNTGERFGTETVQLYIRDKVGEVVRPIKELIDFKQVSLNPGESKEVYFDISENQLRYIHSDHTYRSDSGVFELGIGTDSTVKMTQNFKLI